MENLGLPAFLMISGAAVGKRDYLLPPPSAFFPENWPLTVGRGEEGDCLFLTPSGEKNERRNSPEGKDAMG